MDANEFNLALREFAATRNLVDPSTSDLFLLDLTWGLLLSNWWSGNELEAKKMFDALVQTGPELVSVAELKKLPLVWSESTLVRIQGAIDHFGKKK